MSLSPILSIMKDFLKVGRGAGSGLLGSKFRDLCNGLLATFLLSSLEVIGFLDKDGEFPFLVEEADVNGLLGVEAGFEFLGVEICDALDLGSIDFFFVLAALLSLVTEATYPK